MKRYFGSWSVAYHRFTSNLTTPRIRVKTLASGQKPTGGIPCVLHWVKREDVIRSDKGSLCVADGWPTALWKAFVSQLDNLPGGTVAEKLQSFLDSGSHQTSDVVSQWRKVLSGRDERRESAATIQGWLPVPATLITHGEEPGHCLMSWSPGSTVYRSLSDALDSPEAARRRPDLASQARYYAECILGKLHGVSFANPDDFLEDLAYAARPEVRETLNSLTRLERERIADPALGLLDRFGGQ